MRGTHRLRLYKYMILVMLISVLLWMWGYLPKMNVLPIKVVKVEGTYRHVMPDELKAIIYPFTQVGFLTFNMRELQHKLIQLPWIAEVVINRVWPDTVKIKINEKNVVARWGENELLSGSGEIFQPEKSSIPTDLPQLIGPTINAKNILKAYQKMSKLLDSVGLQISILDMSKHYQCEVKLTNGTVLRLGENDSLSQVQRFVRSYDDLIIKQDTFPAQVDLRYPDGMAVEW